MAAIDIGPGATDRATYWVGGYTWVDKINPANDTGSITSFELWFHSVNGGGVKVGTFSGSGVSWDDRDYETIGTVTAGSKQTFSGLDCDVVTGDVIGFYAASGDIEADGSGGDGGYAAGDKFGLGAQTYTASAAIMSIYGTGTTAGATIEPSAIASAEAFGTAKLNLELEPSAIASAEAFGTAKLILKLLPSAIASAETFGAHTVTLTGFIQPTGIASGEAFGTAAVISDQFLEPGAIASGEAFGTATIVIEQFLSPTGIPSAEAFGTFSLSFATVIIPVTISSGEVVPSPRLIREIIHIILDSQYITLAPGVNRAYVIGQDSEGNPVHGTDLEQDDIDLVGERLDFQQQLSVPTSALAADVADAILKKRRLTKHAGFILIPPNAGAELWDVIQVTDSPCAQALKKYRIAGIGFEYQPRKTTYEHRIILAAP